MDEKKRRFRRFHATPPLPPGAANVKAAPL
jgi:hypothetical protein